MTLPETGLRCMPRTQIAVAVVVAEGRVLVGRRSAVAIDAPGLHEFPGGKVEPGEPPESAAVRECLEEVGLAIRVRRRLDAIRAESSSGPTDVLFFVAEPTDAALAPRPPFEWRRVAALEAGAFPPANASVIGWLRRHHGGS
jgi:8-oxo-dGTP diphosphatase